jgi:DNA-binding winged helix-turn-helix (wHTH) protein
MTAKLDDAILLGSRFLFRKGEGRLLRDGEQVSCGSRALDVLAVLVENKSETVGKLHLIDRVWPNTIVEENNLQVQISTLRKILGANAIATVPGRGYRFCMAVGIDGQSDEDTISQTKHMLTCWSDAQEFSGGTKISNGFWACSIRSAR